MDAHVDGGRAGRSAGGRWARLALVAGALALPFVSLGETGASEKGPFPGFTGAPGEDTCRHCHDTFPLNSAGGALTVEGFPEVYTPGETYHVTVTLASDSALCWGFQATALTERETHAGKFIVTDRERTKVVRGFFIPDRTYVEQKRAGSYDGQRGSVSWSFDWRAPKRNRGVVTLYVCGNAANENEKPTGDLIYYTQVSAVPAP